jgi:uncharacterized protein
MMESHQKDTIEEVTRRIVSTVQPQKILLFGSAARGEADEFSDLDFLVIVKSPAHRRRTAQQIYRNLHGIQIPVDIIVATEVDIRVHGQAIGSILRPALREGIVIYEHLGQT